MVEKFPTVLEKLPQVLRGDFFDSHCTHYSGLEIHSQCCRKFGDVSHAIGSALTAAGPDRMIAEVHRPTGLHEERPEWLIMN